MADLKAKRLASLKEDISSLLRSEMKDFLAGEFDAVKSEIQAVKNVKSCEQCLMAMHRPGLDNNQSIQHGAQPDDMFRQCSEPPNHNRQTIN